MTERYTVVEGSQSAHCCFAFTVVDTTKPVMVNGAQYKGQFEALCECWERSEADQIARALNIDVRQVMREELANDRHARADIENIG